jgi:hypothetical protein
MMMMIMQPEVVSDDLLRDTIKAVGQKKDLPSVDKLRIESFDEGRAAEALHLGPFKDEGPNVEKLHSFVDARGKRTGKHHEIYLSDIRKANPAKWKTIIRQPFN